MDLLAEKPKKQPVGRVEERVKVGITEPVVVNEVGRVALVALVTLVVRVTQGAQTQLRSMDLQAEKPRKRPVGRVVEPALVGTMEPVVV